ncbi:unnamed protein product [Eruca vesicaria subsp. sativa]|uniref:Uncharacterized protein n=1 Tax=Eruca vesicaria subsp. sativa TaxID=29727 RepID=A0ABC8L9D2_ERUVS|nr:unnamed protein product [Eruca vesicaria subsp. sativa]
MGFSSLIVSIHRKHIALVFICLVLILKIALVSSADQESQIYTVHLGERQHDHPKLVTDSHHAILSSLLGSKRASRESMIYSYRHGFSGFSAKLTPSQARELSEHPDVVHVTRSTSMKLATTRVNDYLGLSPSTPTGLLHETDMGSEAIIGILDTGIWPDSKSFNDMGLGPIPARWKGRCVSGDGFNASSSCNRKLIGARYYAKGLLKKYNGTFNVAEKDEVMSPLEKIGHGTHSASIAAGSFVQDASFFGLASGTARGSAPRARIASYKVCWNKEGCFTADTLKAIDHAIRDGVDVLSISVEGGIPPDFEVDRYDFAIGAFHAVMKGIPVVCAGGNDGPHAQTISNIAPWIITVAATTMDREFFTPITLGNNVTVMVQVLYMGKEVGFTGILYIGDLTEKDFQAGKAKGKILFAFTNELPDETEAFGKANGIVGFIIAIQPFDEYVEVGTTDIPRAYVDHEIGMDIMLYLQTNKFPKAKISPTKTFVGRPFSTKVASFSSRGPNSISPAILKPDIAAPGVGILAAVRSGEGYGFESGTSAATPIVSGIVALIKQKRPDWSPAAIRSALVTTALQTDPFGEPISAEGAPRKLADPFDYGGGLVNPGKVADPGLVYDMGYDDYAHYLCSAGYENKSISKLLGKRYTCPSPTPSMLDVNLPSITIPYLNEEIIITRTVTNVGPVGSVYKAVIEPPLGIKLQVSPQTLKFGPNTKKITFTVKVSTTHRWNTDYLFGSLTWTDNGAQNVRIPLSIYTVHLGERQHDDPKLVTDSHYDILRSLLGSKKASRESMIYSYRHGFSGFSAKLTPSQARELSEHPDVVHVTRSKSMKLTTTRVNDYLGLSPTTPTGLLHETDMGSEAIIGILDTGIWPDSKSFNDMGLGPIPARWKGRCVSGDGFNASSSCNRKLIGARYYAKGLLKKYNGTFNPAEKDEVMSPLDKIGHGSHCASIAAGSFVQDASFFGLALGTARGSAPRARIASYKVCWSKEECFTPDILKAIDHSIRDGVDVLSLSLGDEIPLDFEVDRDDFAIGAFHAVMKGIPVVCAGGNEGPYAQTISNVAPWIINVAATTMDREFFTPITLGNNVTVLGRDVLYTRKEVGFTGIVYFGDLTDNEFQAGKAKGKILFAFRNKLPDDIEAFAKANGIVGLIIATQPFDNYVKLGTTNTSRAYVDYEIGMDIMLYLQTNKFPKAKISPTKTFVGRPFSTKVARFSSRGPNSISPAILKPDIAAPGVGILASVRSGEGYGFMTGTSMSTPIVSGIVALLRQKRPDWSPAAIRSALVTTAFQTDPFGEPIVAEGSPRKLADPFDYGGGLVNPGKVADPGLVYDMGYDDYAHYLCSAGYENKSISKLLGKRYTCPSPTPSMLDVNLPSITIPYLNEEIIITRTVTNVGPVDAVYKAVIEPPLGIKLQVSPETLEFGPNTKNITFTVKVSTTHRWNTDYLFGSLTWTDNGAHYVRIPLSVRTRLLNFKI